MTEAWPVRFSEGVVSVPVNLSEGGMVSVSVNPS